jgi:hypothetical protein
MEHHFKKLSYDVIRHIISYTYNIQDKNLLKDIKNYKETKTKIFENYTNFWIDDINFIEPEDKYWLLYDLIEYSNLYTPTNEGYVDNFYNLFFRIPLLKTKREVDKYIIKLEKKRILTQINIFWGLFTNEEREDLVGKIYIL